MAKTKMKTSKKRPHGSKTVSIRLHAHAFLVHLAEQEHVSIYEAVEKIERHYAASFCPELLKILNNA